MGGLGFGMKWNMGWMHDTLEYFTIEPSLRGHHQELLTFASLYAFTENFMLSLSHDEVVHGKGSLLARMPGDRLQRFANLRLLYVYMWTYPGKKSLFMGNEFAQEQEWSFSRSLDWELLNQKEFQGIHSLLRDLNNLYRSLASLHAFEFSQEGFEWLDCQEPAQSIIVYLRHDGIRSVVVVFNFSAMARSGYRIGVPYAGPYQIVLNSDAHCYGGSTVLSASTILASPEACMGQICSIALDLPPLTALVLVPY
jgi:1,4-alpha-glucan branching enzyme